MMCCWANWRNDGIPLRLLFLIGQLDESHATLLVQEFISIPRSPVKETTGIGIGKNISVISLVLGFPYVHTVFK